MRLLIIGPLAGQLGAASRIAVDLGARVMHADDIATGLRVIRGGQGVDLVMIDVELEVARLFASLRDERIAVPVVGCGVGSHPAAAVAAIEAGAKEFIPLPPDADLIAAILAAISEDSRAVLHHDPAMARVVALAERIAPSEASVLITGESGTGKEVLARHLHARSRRASARFVAVNCAAIPEALLETELFGHEKGAFTGAIARRIGRFEEAHGGTLLLDEISEMDIRLQAKLLRAIQEREIDRIGGTKPVKVDVRIIATSNRDLENAVASGAFRQDLYFRLNVVNLRIPPLRERSGDIPLLAEHFAQRFAAENALAPRPLAAAAQQRLLNYRWPGNVRELENIMHRAVLFATGEEIDASAIELRDAGEDSAAPDCGGPAIGSTLAAVERELILGTLSHCLGNRTHAATILGISIRTMRNKLRQYSDEGHAVAAPGQAHRVTT
ncbi:MAG: sigma-54-dependent Fis family transcriptional regulator [Rhodospirillales bacterium]|nr:sigma-54-dependent Fis family transcriptional regulator [Rhodospirillales bacterium]